MEKVVVVIKPDAERYEDKIVYRIKRDGFMVLDRKRVALTREQAVQYYNVTDDETEPQTAAIDHLASGPSVILIISRFNGIDQFKALCGPTSVSQAKQFFPKCLRAEFAKSEILDAVAGSDSTTRADREQLLFFPNNFVENVPNAETSKLFLETSLYPLLTQGLTELCKTKPENPTAWLGNWLCENNPAAPKVEV